MPRSYAQFCALARALDLIGERWTLLLVRELLLGPRRYTDLLRGLPGIGTNLLARRLRELEAAQLIERMELPPPASGGAYSLTERGRGLKPALLELARWGTDPIEPPSDEDSTRPAWYALAMQANFRPSEAAPEETYEFRIEDEVFHLQVSGSTIDAGQGLAGSPAVTVECDTSTLLRLLTGELSPADANRSSQVSIRGEDSAVRRWLSSCRLPIPRRLIGAAAG